MTKEEVIQYLDGVNGKTIKLGLGPITALMEALDWPDKDLKIIHITGTNGKGSVCEMLSQMLQCGGYKVGTFNTPYFETHNECIRINNEMISDKTLLRLMNQIEPILHELAKAELLTSGFEILTALALLYFKEAQVDFVILEVGLGGRLDATNVIQKSILTIITKIAMDHQNFLGNSLEAIAKEKAGIIKKEGIVLMPIQEEGVMEVVKAKCKEQQAIYHTLSTCDIKAIEVKEDGVRFNYKEETYRLRMLGKYQAYNASLAIEAVQLLKRYQGIQMANEQIKEGLKQAIWAGRFEKVMTHPLCFIDGAHNVDGVLALADTLKALPKRETIAIVGMLRDKETHKMLEVIMPYIDTWIVTKPLNPRAKEVTQLAQKIKCYTHKVYGRERIEDAYQLAKELADKNEQAQIIAFGSLYMLGQLRVVIREEVTS